MHIAWSLTGAGKRQGLKAPAKDWVCPKCGATLRYYWRTCPHDGETRPKEQ